ncbi:hypothetical protein FB451DRAFT_1369713 [Mycena latifolia]|nr:hypothetical protein FB451DRAFT_1369713 [Mycena latifolia]
MINYWTQAEEHGLQAGIMRDNSHEFVLPNNPQRVFHDAQDFLMGDGIIGGPSSMPRCPRNMRGFVRGLGGVASERWRTLTHQPAAPWASMRHYDGGSPDKRNHNRLGGPSYLGRGGFWAVSGEGKEGARRRKREEGGGNLKRRRARAGRARRKRGGRARRRGPEHHPPGALGGSTLPGAGGAAAHEPTLRSSYRASWRRDALTAVRWAGAPPRTMLPGVLRVWGRAKEAGRGEEHERVERRGVPSPSSLPSDEYIMSPFAFLWLLKSQKSHPCVLKFLRLFHVGISLYPRAVSDKA